MPEEGIKVLVFTNGTASTKWRFDGVADRINKLTNHEMFVTDYQHWNGDTLGADIVVLEQLTGPHIVRQCHAMGAKVIFEADDAMIDSYGRERKNLMNIAGAFKGNAIETIKLADACTVTTEKLKENYARFTDKKIYVLPNYVDFEWYGKGKLKVPRVSDEIRLGWFGSRGHFEDLRSLLPVLQELLKKYSNLRFIYCGYGGFSSDKLLTEVGWGEDVFKELPRSQREFYISVPPDYWPMKHQTLDLDIGICPLIKDYFNECKTPIKWMEYAALETPAVVSDVLYSDVVEDGKTALVAKTEQDWLKNLTSLIEDGNLRQTIGKAANREVVNNWNIEDHWNDWLNAYQEVLGRGDNREDD